MLRKTFSLRTKKKKDFLFLLQKNIFKKNKFFDTETKKQYPTPQEIPNCSKPVYVHTCTRLYPSSVGTSLR